MKKFINLSLNILIYIAIVGGIVYGLPRYLSWKYGTEYPIAAITSGSMWPELHIGDLVLIEKVAKEDIRKGDIIVWRNYKGFTIHRVVKLNNATVITKGDGNFTEDDPIKYEYVIGRTVDRNGKPFRVPYLGYVSVWSTKLRADNL